jgi:3-dehydroquinate synthetase
LRSAKLPTRLADIEGSLPEPRKLLEIMRQDKKAVAGKLTFILVRGIGEAFIERGIGEKDVLAFLAEEQAQA